ncbi:MAG: zinc ribbon domain-containing protein [Ruminococcus sp.]|nr:zinc ribbon domain-containing protein [Ruminococcus sp.]
MPDCPTCGLPVKEGERFCNACGSRLPHIVKQSFCPVCGNTLLEGARVCNLCGTKVGGDDTTAAEVIAQQQEAMKNPSMDELFVPVITDEMLGLTNQPVVQDMPTMDAVTMPGSKPKPKPAPAPQPSYSGGNIPMPGQMNAGSSVPTPSAPMQTGGNPSVNIQKTPQVPPTPVVNDTSYQQGFAQNSYQQQPQNNMYQQSSYQQPQNNTYQQGGYQQPQAVITPEGIQQQPYGQAPNMQQGFPQSNIPQGNYQQQPAQQKKGLNPVQIILIVAIIGVLIADFFLFGLKDKLFGGNKNKAKSNTSIVRIADLDE